jgi:hypothetical protein
VRRHLDLVLAVREVARAAARARAARPVRAEARLRKARRDGQRRQLVLAVRERAAVAAAAVTRLHEVAAKAPLERACGSRGGGGTHFNHEPMRFAYESRRERRFLKHISQRRGTRRQ